MMLSCCSSPDIQHSLHLPRIPLPNRVLHCHLPLAFRIINQVSGGFATVHPNNKLTINAVEAAPLDAFSAEVRTVAPSRRKPALRSHLSTNLYDAYLSKAVRANLQEALKVASGNGSEEDKVEARIEADVYEALQHALAK